MAADTTRTVTVRVLGDVSNAKAALTDTATAAEGTGKRAAAAFGPFTSVLGKLGLSDGPIGTVVSALSGITTGLGNIDSKLPTIQRFGTYGAAAGAGIAGLGAAVEELGSPLEQSRKQLETAISDAGGNFDTLSGRISTVDSKMESYGHRTTETNQALATLTEGLHNPAEAMKYMGEVADIAAAKHISLSDAASLVVRVHAGSSRVLKQFGIDNAAAATKTSQLAAAEKAVTTTHQTLITATQRLSDLETIDSAKKKLSISDEIALRDARQKVTDATGAYHTALASAQTIQDSSKSSTQAFSDNMAALAGRISGQASASVDTFGGKLDVLKTKVLDGAAAFGAHYGPAIMGTGAVMSGLGGTVGAVSAIIGHFRQAAEVATGATEAMTGATEGMTVAEDAAAVSEGIALAPLALIIAGVVAVGVAAYELVTHWSTVWAAVKAGAEDVWHFLDGIWQDVEGGVSTAWSWVKDHLGIIIPVIVGIVTGGVGVLPALIVTHWHTIENDAKAIWGDIVGFFTGIPGKLIGAVGDIGSKFVKWIDDGWHAFQQADVIAVGTVLTFFEGIPGKILGALGDAAKTLYKWGSDLIGGLISGIKSMAGSIGGAIKGVFDDIPGVSLLKKVPGLGWLETGGPAQANMPYIVGEAGPELFVPTTSGVVIPNNALGDYTPDLALIAGLATGQTSAATPASAMASASATTPLASVSGSGPGTGTFDLTPVTQALSAASSAITSAVNTVDSDLHQANSDIKGSLDAVKSSIDSTGSATVAGLTALLDALHKNGQIDAAGFAQVSDAVRQAAASQSAGVASLDAALLAHK